MGAPYLVADRALYSEENLATLAQTAIKWITRVPATLSEVQATLAHAEPQAMASLQEGYRYHEMPSTYGGGRGATLGPHLLRAPPGAGAAHRRQALAHPE